MKTDLRVIKSRTAIENAFINLVEIKGFQNVTITEIADKAMVNRNTIYLNYGSKEDILESIIIRSLEKYFGTITPEYFRSFGLSKKKIEEFYRNFFKAIDENIELYRIVLTDPSAAGYLQTKFAKLRKDLEQITKHDDENRIRISFLTNGIMGVLANYIKLAIGTREDNIKILTELSIANLRHISYQR